MIKGRIALLFLVGVFFVGCGGGSNQKAQLVKNSDEDASPLNSMLDKGVGSVKAVNLSVIDDELVAEGKDIFNLKCIVCHQVGVQYVGPDLTGIINRQSPEWIMNMILNPEKMVANNTTARELSKEFSAPMVNQNLTEAEARKVLEYFRTL